MPVAMAEALAPCRAVVALPAEERWVNVARHFASALLAQWGIGEDDCDRAILIVGELAGNAALHGRADMAVSLSRVDGTLRIEVTDSGASCSRSARPGDAEQEYGRGLEIVSLLADRTETARHPRGWRTCVDVRLAPTPSWTAA
jgi:anti-sigma regulatory factor (Ser/Thr protein kinase)